MSVQSVERVFDILDAVARERDGISLSRLSSSLELHKSTVHRLLGVCRKRGYIQQDEHSSLYRLGPHVIELSSQYLNKLEIKTEAGPVLQKLSEELKQTVFIAVLMEGSVVYIDKFEETNSIRRYTIIGQRRPVHCTSLGKALLLDKDESEIRKILPEEPFHRFTPCTRVSMLELSKELDQFRRQGWTTDIEEFEDGVSCIGAPVYDYRGVIIAAVSTAWVKDYGKPEQSALVRKVTEAAGKISRKIGYCG